MSYRGQRDGKGIIETGRVGSGTRGKAKHHTEGLRRSRSSLQTTSGQGLCASTPRHRQEANLPSCGNAASGQPNPNSKHHSLLLPPNQRPSRGSIYGIHCGEYVESASGGDLFLEESSFGRLFWRRPSSSPTNLTSSL